MRLCRGLLLVRVSRNQGEGCSLSVLSLSKSLLLSLLLSLSLLVRSRDNIKYVFCTEDLPFSNKNLKENTLLRISKGRVTSFLKLVSSIFHVYAFATAICNNKCQQTAPLQSHYCDTLKQTRGQSNLTNAALSPQSQSQGVFLR